MYKCVHEIAPTYLYDHLTYASEVHEHDTRGAAVDALYIPRANTQYYQRSLAVAGPTLWNNLPEHIRHAVSIGTFKYKYKLHFGSIQQHSEDTE